MSLAPAQVGVPGLNATDHAIAIARSMDGCQSPWQEHQERLTVSRPRDSFDKKAANCRCSWLNCLSPAMLRSSAIATRSDCPEAAMPVRFSLALYRFLLEAFSPCSLRCRKITSPGSGAFASNTPPPPHAPGGKPVSRLHCRDPRLLFLRPGPPPPPASATSGPSLRHGAVSDRP